MERDTMKIFTPHTMEICPQCGKKNWDRDLKLCQSCDSRILNEIRKFVESTRGQWSTVEVASLAENLVQIEDLISQEQLEVLLTYFRLKWCIRLAKTLYNRAHNTSQNRYKEYHNLLIKTTNYLAIHGERLKSGPFPLFHTRLQEEGVLLNPVELACYIRYVHAQQSAEPHVQPSGSTPLQEEEKSVEAAEKIDSLTSDDIIITSITQKPDLMDFTETESGDVLLPENELFLEPELLNGRDTSTGRRERLRPLRKSLTDIRRKIRPPGLYLFLLLLIALHTTVTLTVYSGFGTGRAIIAALLFTSFYLLALGLLPLFYSVIVGGLTVVAAIVIYQSGAFEAAVAGILALIISALLGGVLLVLGPAVLTAAAADAAFHMPEVTAAIFLAAVILWILILRLGITVMLSIVCGGIAYQAAYYLISGSVSASLPDPRSVTGWDALSGFLRDFPGLLRTLFRLVAPPLLLMAWLGVLGLLMIFLGQFRPKSP
jgi:hypothetical protein